MPELVGRERELAAIERLLDRASDGLAVLAIEGEAGIGKSALLAATLDRARERSMRVLQCRPVAAEAKLAFASLTDLLGPLADDGLETVPEPQRVALEVALLRRTDPGGRLAPRAVAAGALTLLSEASGDRPLLLAIDDAQWLDSASASVIGFAIRRLEDRRIGLVLARRADASAQPGTPMDLDRIGPDRLETLAPQPLSLSGVYHVLRDTLGLRPTRPTLRRIHQASGGNPLLAIELGRAIGSSEDGLAPGSPLPVPESIRSLMARRIGAQPERARLALLIVALLSVPTELLVYRVDRRAGESVDGLIAASILERRDGVLRFTHPLLADVALSGVGSAERRAMHRRLATVVTEPEARARHRALGLDGTDAAVASELARAAAAAARTSVETACELLELSLAATPEVDETGGAERRLALARLRHRAGDTPGATALLDELTARLPAGSLRAETLELRAQIDWVSGGVDRAAARCDEALAQPGIDPWLRARVMVTLARISLDPNVARTRATEALEAIERLAEPDPALTVEALTALAGAGAALGMGIPRATVERALALEAEAPPAQVSDRFSAALGAWLKYEGELEEARTWLRRTHDTAVAEGDEGSLPYALSHLPQLELWVGDWQAAHQAAREHLAVAEWTGQQEQRLTAVYSLALVDAHAGRHELARSRIVEALPEAERVDPWNVYQLLSTLGFVELSDGRPAAALEPLWRAHDIYESVGAQETTATHENLAEALVASGDLAGAGTFIARYLERAMSLARPMGLATALRARALLDAASGNLEAASEAVQTALEHHERTPIPFSRARTLLVAGQVRRRRGERRAARSAFEEAGAIFERLGARAWAARVTEELGRIPARRPAEPGDLTPAERRIAVLVARGMSNREVAAELFVTTKTVETNLTRVYAKLGIRSRSQLAATMRTPPEVAAEL